MSQTPRIRNDLKATPAEEQGVKYFDVSDPRSGSRMRLYDFEWLIAEQMNGARRFDEVASFARDRLGVSPSAEDLSEYAKRLRELGFLELEAGGERASGARDASDEDVTPLPKPTPADEDMPTLRLATEVDTPKLGLPESREVTIEAEEEEEEERTDVRSPSKTPAPAPSPSSLVSPAPRVSTPQPEATSPTGKVDAPVPPPAKGSGSGSLIGVVVVMLVIAGVVGYLKFLKPQVAHVSVMVASPREVVRLFDGAAAVKKTEPQVLSFGEAGKVSDVVAKGTEVKAGMPVATLEAYAQVEKALADVKDRAGFYQKQLDAAKAKNDEAAAKTAESKVAEKHKLMTDLEARATKVRLLALGSGMVTEVLVTAGGDVKAGDAAVKMGEKRMTAEFKVAPAEAPKPGDQVTLQPAAGGATLAGRVSSSAAGAVVVELPDAAAAKAGDQVRLVKKREQNVVPVPAAAVIQRDGADVVFVLTDGEARARKVTVADRSSPAEVLISSGLAAGDSIITSGADSLQDGQKASTQ